MPAIRRRVRSRLLGLCILVIRRPLCAWARIGLLLLTNGLLVPLVATNDFHHRIRRVDGGRRPYRWPGDRPRRRRHVGEQRRRTDPLRRRRRLVERIAERELNL